jgi:hypothetical protein
LSAGLGAAALTFPAFASEGGTQKAEQNALLGALANFATNVKGNANLSIPGLGSLFMGEIPEQLEDWSYGMRGSIKDTGRALANKRVPQFFGF